MESRKKWLEGLQLKNYEPKKSAAVCSVYFKETDYLLDHKYCKFKKDAVPHLLKTEIQPGIAIQSNSDDLSTQCQLDINNTPCQTDLNDQNHEIISIEENTKAGNTNKMVHRSTSISPDRIINSPTKTRIRKLYTDEIKSLKRKLSISLIIIIYESIRPASERSRVRIPILRISWPDIFSRALIHRGVERVSVSVFVFISKY